MPVKVSPLVLLLLAVAADGFSGKALLVSMDGFRWDYIKDISGLSNFIRLAKTGVSVDHVENVFMTKTFPSQYSTVTGLYPESHGIVANAMYDPVRNAAFRKWSKETFWWEGGEPIWITAEKQNRKTAIYFWVGSESEIHGKRPSIYKAYNESVPFRARVETALSWFVDEAMDFVSLYFHEPDYTGHVYGPFAEELKDKVREMDRILGLILDTLDAKNLGDVVNVIVTSDHGMTSVDMETRLLNLWHYVTDRSLVNKVPDSGAVTAVLPADGRERQLLNQLSQIPHVTVYRKEDIPDRFHYKNNPRIMPIIILADEGWILTDNVEKQKRENKKGDHGYSNELPSMRPIFFARGPDFRKGVKSTSIHQVDIYPLLCLLLNIEAAPNNGSVQHIAQFLVDTGSCGSCQSGRLSLEVLLVVVVVLLVESDTE